MILSAALDIAHEVVRTLAPHCERIAIAGSVRRKRPIVKDIEVVCVPRVEEIPDGLFGRRTVRSEIFVASVNRLGLVHKGDLATGRMCQVTMAEITLDLFIARRENWGFILAIRTGSANFSHRILGRGWRRAGCHAEDGMILRNGTDVPVLMLEEEDLFRLIGIPWVEPKERELREE
jgi:DNA polymerase/3'-5' exonuclease PolX